MTEFTIDLHDCYTADDLHARVAEVLPLPDYYGNNLDALHDVLTEQSEGWDITFTGCSDAEVTLGKYMRKLKLMCSAAATENEGALCFRFEE